MRRYDIVLRNEARDLMSLEALATSAGLHPIVVESFVEFGLIEPVAGAGSGMTFDAASVARVRTIVRLRSDIGVNLPGIAVILDLLDRLRAQRQEGETGSATGRSSE